MSNRVCSSEPKAYPIFLLHMVWIGGVPKRRRQKDWRYFMESSKFRAPSPYPPIRVSGPNPVYARILQTDYASADSELTAAHLYVYGSLVLAPECPEAAGIMHGIAVVEMNHLDMLGRMICQLGGNPRFQAQDRRGRMTPWCAAMLPYQTNLKNALQISIQGEKGAIAQYEKHMEMIREEDICVVIRRILEDEHIHLQLLNGLWHRFVLKENIPPC